MSDAKDAAQEILLMVELGKRIRAVEAVARAEFAAAAEPGDRAVWRTEDGGPVGAVSMTEPAVHAVVADMRVLLRWVADRHPSEVVTESTIRPAYLALLLAAAKDTGEPVDPQTGEPVPGITVETGKPVVRAVPAKGASARIDAEWRAGRLRLPGSVLPAIEGGPDA